jgi:hypothetical protein
MKINDDFDNIPKTSKMKKKNQVCIECKEEKKPNCFNKKIIGYENVCVKCRRKLGVESLYSRKSKRLKKHRVKTTCLRCGKKFMSETWGDSDRNRNRICPKCHYWDDEL